MLKRIRDSFEDVDCTKYLDDVFERGPFGFSGMPFPTKRKIKSHPKKAAEQLVREVQDKIHQSGDRDITTESRANTQAMIDRKKLLGTRIAGKFIQ